MVWREPYAQLDADELRPIEQEDADVPHLTVAHLRDGTAVNLYALASRRSIATARRPSLDGMTMVWREPYAALYAAELRSIEQEDSDPDLAEQREDRPITDEEIAHVAKIIALELDVPGRWIDEHTVAHLCNGVKANLYDIALSAILAIDGYRRDEAFDLLLEGLEREAA